MSGSVRGRVAFVILKFLENLEFFSLSAQLVTAECLLAFGRQ